MNELVVFGRAFSRRRAEVLLAVLIAVVALSSTLVASRLLAPSFDELARLQSIGRAEQLVLKIAGAGVSSLSAAELRVLSPDAGAPPALALLFGAWSKLSIGRLGLLDPLTSARLPWLLPSALAPFFVYLIVRPSRGPAVALLAAMFLLFFPRWLLAAGVGSNAAALSGAWLLTIAFYLRATAPAAGSHRRRYCWALGAAAALGLSAVLSLSTLWLVWILLLHHWVLHRSAVRRLVRRGRVPMPATLVLAAAIGPLVFFLGRPELASSNLTQTARALLAVLNPSVDTSTLLGRMAADGSPPVLSYSLRWLLWTLPSVIVVAAVVGLLMIAHRALARRFASGQLRPARDRRALGALVVLGGASTLIGPALAPSPVSVFPPRFELLLPFVAIAGALGVDAAARRAAGVRRAWVPAAVIVTALAWQTLREPATVSAFCAPLLGGASAAMRRKVFAIGDGSELGALLPQLDRLGVSPLALHAPEVPDALWQELKRYGRLQVTVVRGSNVAGLRIERGSARSGRALAVVERDGAALWTLVE